MHLDEIAALGHEVNRAYCSAIGEEPYPAWDEAPQWMREGMLNGVRAVITGAAESPQASHEAWMADKLAAGWSYGEVKDPAAKTHPCLVPYDKLPQEQRVKDYLFRAVVQTVQARGL